jgi:hypothetical protein
MKNNQKRHPNSQIGELASTAVRIAKERRVLSADELESATGGAVGSALVPDWRIYGGLLADKLQVNTFDVNTVKTAGAALQLNRQFG